MPDGLAWKRCRTSAASWREFGLSAVNESGMWFVGGDFVRDIAALNKIELLPWDSWSLLTEANESEDRFSMEPEALLTLLSADDIATLDQLAEYTGNTVDYPAVRLAYQTDRKIRVPRHIVSGGAGKHHAVDLDAVLGSAWSSELHGA